MQENVGNLTETDCHITSGYTVMDSVKLFHDKCYEFSVER